jgi:C1A family cysteine protease
MAKDTTTASNQTFKMGWLPDLPDARDFQYSAPLKVMQKLPAKTDLRSKCPPVYNQGRLGSCTAHALSAAFQVGQKIQGKPTWEPSRLFIYYNERVAIHTETVDSGAFLRDGIKSLNKQGVCKETEWTYDENPGAGKKFAQKPPASCYANALSNQILSYQRLANNIQILKGCLAEGYPFVFGFTVYDSFMSAAVRNSGIMPMPDLSKEHVVGGHAVIAVGYDDTKQALLIRNSWGTGWGIGGYFWMPYAYATNTNLADDFWTIRSLEFSAPKKAAKKTAKKVTGKVAKKAVKKTKKK